jgi:replication factor A1
MTVDHLLDRILSDCPNVSREEVLNRLAKEKTRNGGLISDETLLRMIAAELGVGINDADVSLPSLLIRDLVPNLNDVTVAGKVLAVYSPRTFNGKKSGRFASLLIADSSGVVRVVLWNDQTSLIDSNRMSIGHMIRFSHAYTKENQGRKVELHVGTKSTVEVNPADVDEKDFSLSINGQTFDRIADLKESMDSVNIKAEVVTKPFIREVKTASGESVRVASVELKDDTGSVWLSAWRMHAENVGNMKIGDRIIVRDARVRKGFGEQLEISTRITTLITSMS